MKLTQLTLLLFLASSLFLPVIAQPGSGNSGSDPYRDRSNMAAFGLTYDRYGENLEDWQRTYIEYRRFERRGTYIGRLNVGHRFDITDYQGELEAWPLFGDSWYGHGNIGISGGDLFPELRAGAELYRVLPRGFELSAGLRYLKFSEDDVLIFTGSLNKYTGSWLLIARPFITPQDAGVSTSLNLTARRYFGIPENFASFIGGFGFSPDERRLIDGVADERLLKSRHLGIIGNYHFRNSFELFGELKATWQQFPFADEFIRIDTFETGIRYRF